jgi:DNA invertase Pin-like site-specific DNA recombinase
MDYSHPLPYNAPMKEETPMNQAYSYIRWSSNPQSLGDSERRQLEKSRAYAKEHNLELIEEMTDSGISAFRGKNVAEGKLASFLAAVRDKKIKKGSYLLVEDLDRLSRQDPLTAFGIYADIVKAGIILVTLKDGRQHGDGKGNCDIASLITSLVSMSLAWEENTKKAGRIGEAWSNKRNHGNTTPLTARCPLWLNLPRVDPSNKHAPRHFTVNKVRAAVVKRIFQDSASGIGIHIIMNQLNASKTPTFSSTGGWGKSSIGKILHNRAVLGEYQPCRRIGNKRIPEGEPIQNYYPAIISPDLFYRAEQSLNQRLLHGKPIGGRNSSFNNLFGGILRCSYCGSSIHYQDKGKGHKYLVCYSASAGKGCTVKTGWDYSHFEKSFVQFVYDIDLNSIGSTDVESMAILEIENEIVGLRGTQAAINKQLDITFAAMKEEKLDYFVKKIKELEQQSIAIAKRIESKEKSLEALTQSSRNLSQSKEQIKPLLQRLKEFKNRAEASSKIKSLVETIYVAPVGYRNDFLSFMKNDDDRDVVRSLLELEKNKFAVVHFKNTDTDKLTFFPPLFSER